MGTGGSGTGGSGTGGMGTGGMGTGGSAAAACDSGAMHTAITNNHSHALTIPQADIDAGAQKTYDIKGGSPHSHNLVVTAAHFTMLKAGNSVMITTSSGTHMHTVTLRCS
jgi:hypothetical protein